MGLLALAGGVGFTAGSLPVGMMMAFSLPRVEDTLYMGFLAITGLKHIGYD